MRVICGYCSNCGKGICKECTWLHTRYPSHYEGKKFNNQALKLASKPLGGLKDE